MSDYDNTIKRLEERISALERVGIGSLSEEDKRLDSLLRKFARSIEMTAWLGGLCLKIAPIVAAVWFFGEEMIKWMHSFIPGPK